ncbi:MAG: hypothetical protein AAF533_18945 [Acidobacteriota bacterium]
MWGPGSAPGGEAFTPQACLDPELDEGFAARLRKDGWSVLPLSREALDRGASPGSPRVVVFTASGATASSRLALVEELVTQQLVEAAVFLADEVDEAHVRWATTFTPYVYRGFGSPVVHLMLDRIAQQLRATASVATARQREVAIRLWESVEIDGRGIRLGPPERNFLFTLAGQRGMRLGKDTDVDVGRGARLPARDCRRRLGQRLGPELCELLIPVERDEPYRMREADEVEAVCQEAPWRHAPTRVHVVGRSSVSTINAGLMGHV